MVALVLAVGVERAEAQQPRKALQLGFLAASSSEREASRVAAFRQAMRELGYVDGAAIVMDERYADGQLEKLPAMAAELASLKIDMLVVAGAPAAHAAKAATSSVPIVMTNTADPVGTGLVQSLARPGGNITGLSDFNAGVVGKRLQLLKEVVPAVSRVAALSNPANPTHRVQVKLLQDIAPTLGVTLLGFEARASGEIDRAFAAMGRERAQALIVVADPLFGAQERRIVELANTGRLPSMFGTRQSADAGALMSYGTAFEDLYRRAATYVDKIAMGANPATLPIEQPTTFELVVNLRTARRLGIAVAQSVLIRAAQVIE